MITVEHRDYMGALCYRFEGRPADYKECYDANPPQAKVRLYQLITLISLLKMFFDKSREAFEAEFSLTKKLRDTAEFLIG